MSDTAIESDSTIGDRTLYIVTVALLLLVIAINIPRWITPAKEPALNAPITEADSIMLPLKTEAAAFDEYLLDEDYLLDLRLQVIENDLDDMRFRYEMEAIQRAIPIVRTPADASDSSPKRIQYGSDSAYIIQP